MKKFFRIAAIVLLTLVCLLLGVWLYLYETMTVGDTRGLLERLSQLERVASVEDYYTYEGNSFFTLKLTNGGTITLGGVGNQDLIAQDGMVVEKVGLHEILCTNDSEGTVTVGISVSEIEAQYLQDHKLTNIQALIKNYKKLDELFSRMPLKFNRSFSSEKSSVWTCANR